MYPNAAPTEDIGDSQPDVRGRQHQGFGWRPVQSHRAGGLLLSMEIILISAALTVAACGGGGGGANPSVSAARAPEFPPGHTWFNVREPLTMAGLQGKVVLLDFWTLGCINCQHIIPDLRQLEEEFGDELVVIGVHSGKYDREHADDAIRQAILQFGVDHPVVNDPDFVIWSAYGAVAWPDLFLIDPEGNIVEGHAGEGVYSYFESHIKRLVARFQDKGVLNRSPVPLDLEAKGVVSTVLSYPTAVLADEAGDRLFIADAGHNRILITGLDGALRDVIGSGQEGLTDGSFEQAALRQPQGLALSPDGNRLYIADTRNHAIRAVDLTAREVTTIAGSGRKLQTPPKPDNSPAKESDLASPWGLALYERTLYIAMAGVHQIWALDLDRMTVSAFAGTGYEGIRDALGKYATLAQPNGLTTDGVNLYWVDPESSAVREIRIANDGFVKTLVGKGLFDFGDRDGIGEDAALQHPQGIAYSNGKLYIVDTYNHKVRVVDPLSRGVQTLAGSSKPGFKDGIGADAQLDQPGGISAAGSTLYIADTNNHVVRVLDLATNALSTLQFSNLSVAARGMGSRVLTVSLPGETVAPEATSLRIRLVTPDQYHLNNLAPSELKLTSSNAPVLRLETETVTWSSNDPVVEVGVPVHLHNGDAILHAHGPVYYCRGGAEAICLIQQLDIALPVTVAQGSPQREIVLDYTLPALASQR